MCLSLNMVILNPVAYSLCIMCSLLAGVERQAANYLIDGFYSPVTSVWWTVSTVMQGFVARVERFA